MIYVEMLGRIGNQMFSYAFARYIQEKYKKGQIAFDFSNYEFTEKDKYSLQKFNCWANITIQKRQYSIIQRIILWLYYKQRNRASLSNERDIMLFERRWQDLLSIFGIFICSFNYHRFRFKPISKNILLIGFFESWQFFYDIDNLIHDEFMMDEKTISRAADNLLKMVRKTQNSICVGIRRGDFESYLNKKQCSVCDERYYEKAIECIKKKVDNPFFYIFTDDPGWVNNNIQLKNSMVIGDEEILFDEKLYVMTNCRHFIISNSTYIWWAQHLSNCKDKIVIAPSKWRNITPETHMAIFEEGWITIPTE